jgi:macrolide transport system ATP-binding/permease protein
VGNRDNQLSPGPRKDRDRRLLLIDSILADLRYAFRTLAKSPAFTAVALLTLALGIGANTAIFSLVNAILMRPLPVVDPDQLVSLSLVNREGSGLGLLSYPDYKDLRDRNQVLAGLAAYRFAPVNLGRNGSNERVWGYLASGNYFDLLGVKAARGRTFSPEEDRAQGVHPVVVLSHGCFQRRFGGDSDIVGQTILLNGRPFTVIGIAPEGFTGTERIITPEIWVPSMMQSSIDPAAGGLDSRESAQWFTVGRLKPAVKVASAQAELNALAGQIVRDSSPTNEGKTVQLNPPGLVIPQARAPALGLAAILMVTVGLVLLIVCANLAGLLLARATERRKEIAIRLALGASRGRLVRQLLTESMLLAVSGGVVGILLAVLMANLVVALKPPLEIALTVDLELDYRVLGFTLALSLSAGVILGLFPALQSTRVDVAPALKDENALSGYRRSRIRSGMIVAQVALSFVLLIAAGLIVRSLQHAQALGPGFEIENGVVMSVNPSLNGYGEERAQEFYRQMVARAETLPGVSSASVTLFFPLSLHYLGVSIHVEGQEPPRGAGFPEGMQGSVGRNYFSTMGIRLIAGRDFTEQDTKDSAPVAIVNETFARRFWPNQTAVGERFATEDDGPLIEVIGVAADGKYFSLSEDPRLFVYRPLAQAYVGGGVNDGILIVRAVADPTAVIPALRTLIQELDPNLAVFDVKTLGEHMRLSLFPLRVGATVVGSFGLLALALAAIGIYGVIAYAVNQRRHEIGIRMALGATARDILSLIVGNGLRMILAGMILGAAASLALSGLLASLLLGVSATDPVTYTFIALLLISVGLLACYFPARRATKADPLTALRHE